MINLAIKRCIGVALVLFVISVNILLNHFPHNTIATYHLQLLEFHEGLLHSRLVDFNLFILLTKGNIMIALALGGSA